MSLIPDENKLEGIVARIKAMDKKDADRLEILGYIKHLTFYINNVTGGWINLFNNPNMSKASRGDLVEIFDLLRDSSLKFLNMAIEFNQKMLDQTNKLIREGFTV